MYRKKITIILVLVFVIVLGIICSVAVNTNSKYHVRQPIGSDANNWSDFQQYSKDSDDYDDLNNLVPIYEEEELLFNTNGAFDLGRDAGVYNWLNHRPNSTNIILNLYPTKAIRQKDDKHSYFVYDTDTGYRLFLFFANDTEKTIDSSGIYLQGYPILIKDIKSYKDFKSIKPGCSIDEVCTIDSVAKLHKIQFSEVWELSYLSVKNGGASKGLSCVSMHYLEDGLLKIEYDMLENGEYVVSNLIYSKDRVITDICGVDIDYNIIGFDLPE